MTKKQDPIKKRGSLSLSSSDSDESSGSDVDSTDSDESRGIYSTQIKSLLQYPPGLNQHGLPESSGLFEFSLSDHPGFKVKSPAH